MLEVVLLGDPRLHQESALIDQVDAQIVDLANQMFEAMYEAKGIGLAGVQVGHLLRLFVTHVPRDRKRVFINPEIIETSVEEEEAEEGCLSIPGVDADVRRPSRVAVQARNLKGRYFRLNADDLLGRVVQHELDHLNGVLFTDRLPEEERLRVLDEYHSDAGVVRRNS